jgi:hypothetical protein
MNTLDQNLNIASNLYRASAVVCLIDYFVVKPRPGMIIELLTLVFTILIARLIRKGYKWVKWGLVVISALFITLYILSLFMVKTAVMPDIFEVVVSLLQIIALIYLFLPYTEPQNEEIMALDQ